MSVALRALPDSEFLHSYWTALATGPSRPGGVTPASMRQTDEVVETNHSRMTQSRQPRCAATPVIRLTGVAMDPKASESTQLPTPRCLRQPHVMKSARLRGCAANQCRKPI